MIINVTQSDIDNGTPNHSNQCPIAIALRRVLPVGCYVHVGRDEVQIGAEYHQLPEPAQSFVCRFDRGLAFNPFAFELPIA